MAVLGYNHEKLANMEKFIAENDIEALVLDQLYTMHIKVCQSTKEHVRLASGPNKGRCKYCLKMIAKPIEEPVGPGPGP